MGFFGPEVDPFRRMRMSAGSVVGSRESVEEKDGIGATLVECAPGGVGQLCSGNATSFPESEIAERKKGSGVVGHGQRVEGNWGF